MKKKEKINQIRNKIIDYCSEYRSSKEISEYLNMNFNTVRSKYVYKLIKEGHIKKKKTIRDIILRQKTNKKIYI